MSRVENLIKESFSSVLRESGFRRKGHRWNRERGSFIDVVEVQRPKVNITGDESFAVEGGVFVPEFYEPIWREKPPQFAKTVDCPVRARTDEIARIAGAPPSRQWWRLVGEDDYESLKVNMPSVLRELVLPFLERYKSMADIHAALLNPRGMQAVNNFRKFHLAIAKAKLGDITGAKSVLEEAAKTGWGSRATLVAGALGITLDSVE